ncbi:MAG: aconitate hydratase AcnA [Cycloclasticus sp.]|nr:aconitate hydratase AcnA [Cycloclasticus sp.]
MNKSDHKPINSLLVDDVEYHYHSFEPMSSEFNLGRLPFAGKILLENLLRHQDEIFVEQSHIDQVARWDFTRESSEEIPFVPARVLLQDFTGVPAIVDLAAMRDAMQDLNGDPTKINPLKPVELVIDHSVMVDHFAEKDAKSKNTQLEIERNAERYQFLKWGQQAFDNFKVVPPGTGIVHQVNLEYLARVVFEESTEGNKVLFPDTLVGTDSHTTMINGLGILGWGVGGIEAEAAMLGQPISMLLPEVVGFELVGELAPGITATDLVLTVTQQLREFGVVGKFVEFFGEGLSFLSVADRATIANMAPEYGATCGLFPIDQRTLDYLELTGREPHKLNCIKAYAQAMGFWGGESQTHAAYHHKLKLDLSQVEACIAGPHRPQDRIPLSDAASRFNSFLTKQIPVNTDMDGSNEPIKGIVKGVEYRDETFELEDGDVVIAAITSCTNTSNPSVLVAAALLAKKAVEKGLNVKPWVKTSFAPGSQVVTAYLQRAGLEQYLEALGFHLVGYGCTTCIGNSGPLPKPISAAIKQGDLTVTSILSGNRNFEGRIHSEIKANYLASPPLVVAYALAGSLKVDITKEPIANDSQGNPVYLKDLWPTPEEIDQQVNSVIDREMFISKYADVYKGDEHWQKLESVIGKSYQWPSSTYVKKPPFFDGMTADLPAIAKIENARCLLKLGQSVTTDHISPAGSIAKDSPAAVYLREQGVEPQDFNSYGSRRGNHDVMARGTFANVRLKNQLAPGTEGSWTTIQPNGETVSVYQASEHYAKENIPTIVLAGKEYGTGSSRDWAAKGPMILGVKAVIAESYERIHRSNLIGMGIMPLQFKHGENCESLGLTGTEQFSIGELDQLKSNLAVEAKTESGETIKFEVKVRIDTSVEFDYFKNGGILQFVLRKLR